MARLVLVRHGQASFGASDYDRLSPVGLEQARRLGEHWAERGVVFDRVFVGPRRRHRQTHDAVAAVFAERGLAWPEPVEWAALDEHDGQTVLERVLPELAPVDPELEGLAEVARSGDRRALKRYLKAFTRITVRWARGEIEVPGVEPWSVFRRRVEEGVRSICAEAGPGEAVAAFTSGGPVAVGVALALGADDATTMELSWSVGNTALTEFRFSGGRFSLFAFNVAAHLEAAQLTFV